MTEHLDLILTAVYVLATQIATIRWLRSDLKRHEKVHSEYVEDHSATTSLVRSNITELYERTNKMLKRSEIEAVVKHEIDPLAIHIDNLTKKITETTKEVAKVNTSMAVMAALNKRDRDERKEKDA